jgi:hypothetical protein
VNQSHRRGVTRGYVGGLIAAVAIVALALVIAAWGGLSLLLDSEPVTTPGIALSVGPLIILVLLALLVWILWAQSLVLLGGKRSPSWPHILLAAGSAYLLWCLGGMLGGLTIEETWMSPFAAAIAVVWGIAAVLCWSVLARRVYTDRPVPQWPWERRGEPGPDWANTDDDPWGGDR